LCTPSYKRDSLKEPIASVIALLAERKIRAQVVHGHSGQWASTGCIDNTSGDGADGGCPFARSNSKASNSEASTVRSPRRARAPGIRRQGGKRKSPHVVPIWAFSLSSTGTHVMVVNPGRPNLLPETPPSQSVANHQPCSC
jgi:hypothetical protein